MSSALPTSTLFIEIRCEELPARFVAPGLRGLTDAVTGLLKHVGHGAVQSWSTPRRLAVAIADVPRARPEEEQLVTGPPVSSAYRDGAPTRAAEGFARGRGVPVEALEVVEGPRGPVVAARITSGGEQTAQILAEGLEAAILGIDFPKTMRWASNRFTWARPIHGVVVIFDGRPVSTRIAGVASGTTTAGHRLSGEVQVDASRPSESWLEGLRANHVEPDRAARRSRLSADLAQHAAALGCTLLQPESLIEEVTDLVEWPVVVPASIDPAFLRLPPRLLVESMKVHQRVFALTDSSGALSHHFLVVSNQPHAQTDPDAVRTIAVGNAKVLAARFHDARFFSDEDHKHSLADHGRALDRMQWIRRGGTMADKQVRIARIAGALADPLGADPEHTALAAGVCKADLCTQMVGEFPELQGHVGRLLATHEGMPDAAALAIEEHYLPRFAGDALPSTPEARAVAMADRMDTLAGCFALGLKPKGGADPLGLRRAGNGLLLLLEDAGARLPLPQVLAMAGHDLDADTTSDLVEFLLARLKAQLAEAHARDLVDAVIASGDLDTVALRARADALAAVAARPEFGPLKTTFKRVVGLTRDHDSADYDPSALVEPAERALHAAVEQALPTAADQAEALDYAGALATLSALKAAVDALFDAVLVMDPDPAVRANRLGLLRTIADAFGAIADFTHLSAEEG